MRKARRDRAGSPRGPERYLRRKAIVRRVTSTNLPAPIASEGLKHIAEFYAIENGIRGHSVDERRLVWQRQSRPRAEAFEWWLRAKLALICQKGKLADAIGYALSRWKGLTHVIDDGRIELDNNAVERSIHPITPNRKTCCLLAPTVAPSTGASSPP